MTRQLKLVTVSPEHPRTLAEVPGRWFATRHQFPLGWLTITRATGYWHIVTLTKRKGSLIKFEAAERPGETLWLGAGDLWRTQAAAEAELTRRLFTDPFPANYVRAVER